MLAHILVAIKARAGLMLALLGWLVMASAIDTPRIQTDSIQVVWLGIGFIFLISGLITMIFVDQ